MATIETRLHGHAFHRADNSRATTRNQSGHAGIEPRASRMLSGCDTTTPRAHVTSSATLSKTPARLNNGDCGSPTSLQLMRRLALRFRRANHYSQIARLRGIDARETLSEWLRRWTRNTFGLGPQGFESLRYHMYARLRPPSQPQLCRRIR